MRSILAPALAALIALPAAAQVLPVDQTGYWTGLGIQPDGQNWDVVLTLYPDGAVVDYPGLSCAGYWHFTEIGAHSLRASEHLAAGFDICEDALAVLAVADAKGTLTITWSYASGAPAASAWLLRD